MGEDFKCGICGREHATWEHRIYEKLRLAEIGVPIENLFVTLPNELSKEEGEKSNGVTNND